MRTWWLAASTIAALCDVAIADDGTDCSVAPALVCRRFAANGGTQTWPVPAGVTSVQVVAVGARGGNGASGDRAGAGHLGKKVATTVSTAGAAVLAVNVANGAPGGAGGAPNGGPGGAATEVSANGARLVVAAGGGGGGGGCAGSNILVIDSCRDPTVSGAPGNAPGPAGGPGGDGATVPVIGLRGGGGGGGGGGLNGGTGGDGGNAFALPTIPVAVIRFPGGDGGDGASFPVAGADADEPPSVVISYVKTTTSLTYTGARTGDYHDAATVAARLNPATAGQTIVFRLNDAESCTAVTDQSGAASCSITPQEPSGSYSLIASYAGDAVRLPSSVAVSFTVTREQTVTSYAGDAIIANAEPARLAAVLREDGIVPIAGRTVTLTLGTGATAQSCSGISDASGAVSCTIAAVNQPLDDSRQVPVVASFAGDAFYLPSTATTRLLLQFMTGDAYGLAGTTRVLLGTVVLSRTPDTGAVRTANGGTTSTPCVLTGPLGSRTLCANVTTTVAAGSSSATASVESVALALGGVLPTLELTAITARSDTSCQGASGNATLGSLRLAGLPVVVAPGPNTTITLPLGGRIVFDEQLPVEGADHGLTVNGAHILVPPVLGLAAIDVVVASATSDIHQCRPTHERRAAGDGDIADNGGGNDEPATAGGCQTSTVTPAWLVGLAWIAVLRRRQRRPSAG